MHGKASGELLPTTLKPGISDEDQEKVAAAADESLQVMPTATVELSYCSVKNGVNDMLDYIALVVALVAPLIIGPCIVGVFQVILLENDQHRHFLLYLLEPNVPAVPACGLT